jgi:hypothetical protein
MPIEWQPEKWFARFIYLSMIAISAYGIFKGPSQVSTDVEHLDDPFVSARLGVTLLISLLTFVLS